MNFLEAHKILKGFKGDKCLNFMLAMSGMGEKLDIFIRAEAAQNGFYAEYKSLPFNTLQQTVLTEKNGDEQEVFILFPWDLVPETDWRSGCTRKSPEERHCYNKVEQFVDRLLTRDNVKLFYVPAPILPIFFNVEKNRDIEKYILETMRVSGATILPSSIFSLGSYLDNGCPFAGAELGVIAESIICKLINRAINSCKVLITDLDNVMWHGVIGEDGIEGIKYEPQGLGYPFFIYQTYLRKLKNEGILIAAVSRNDSQLATMPFKENDMVMGLNDFILIMASYDAKSSQISELAKQLNLGLDSFVFVDDNPVELAEVSNQLPDVNCVLFPSADERFPEFYSILSSHFNQIALTDEDKNRTEMYRNRLKGIVPSNKAGFDLKEFLSDLDMVITVYDRTDGDRARAVQLINKTNQFNMNGERVTCDEVDAILNDHGKLYTASLSDKHGAHGEILACLVDSKGIIRSFVMSCRVFQRRVEYAFLVWLIKHTQYDELTLKYSETDRNVPFRKFIDSPAFALNDNALFKINSEYMLEKHIIDMRLFEFHSEVIEKH